MIANPNRYYFCASNESIYDLMQRGIWHNMALNKEIEPIDSTTVHQVKNEQIVPLAPHVMLNRYVRLITDPEYYLKKWQGNIASIFLVEVDSKIVVRPDILTIQRMKDGVIEHLKNIWVDSYSIQRIHVFSQGIHTKLCSALPSDRFMIPINVSTYLFGVSYQFFDESFDIKKPEHPLPPSPEVLPNIIAMKKGDIFQSPMQAIVNTVNCVGVMGKGIALTFKKKFPDMYRDYEKKCKKNEVQLGKPYCYHISGNRLIINFPTKNHWKENSNIKMIEEGLEYLLTHFKSWGVTSIAFPPLGCGNGKLKWDDVLPLMRAYLMKLSIPVEIYAPHEADLGPAQYTVVKSFQMSTSVSLNKRKLFESDKSTEPTKPFKTAHK